MPVNDVEVHEKVKHPKPPASCYNQPHPFGCRQIGMREGNKWVPLLECVGCLTHKDAKYIIQARKDIDTEMKKFMKADQRIL